ncbi:MAG: potassium channel family protein, partial [Candidatus Entotheonellia bacterium]
MAAVLAVLGLTLIATVLWDTFETVILPRRVTRRFRLTGLFYRYTWLPWSAVARRMRQGRRRETYLGFYGPLSLLLLLSVWAVGLILGFALLQWGLGSALIAPEGAASFGTDLYMSGTTFFTLGLGDVTPHSSMARAVTVAEAGTGFGFLAIVISYLPVLYQAFSRREVNISLLDARAGSPPSATELLRRHSQGRHLEELSRLLYDWEHWSAELLESHLSYPVLGYFRSQHDNQSWLAALTTILDTSALVMVGIDGTPERQAQLTFA